MKLRISLFLAVLMTGAAGNALAGADISVPADEAKMLAVTGEPTTVVVGNPNIADITVQNKHIFVHGRNYGSTNIIVLDKDGNELAALDVTVTMGGSHSVNVFRAGSKFSYACADICESAVQVGDNKDYFDTLESQNKKKSKLATSAGQ
jgi:Flp pilus assembly secretin CpaC